MAIDLTTPTSLPSLSINGLQLSVFLGVYPEELLKKQLVKVDLKLQFLEKPKACLTDNLDDTYCYDRLVQTLKSQFNERRFKLIEYLTHELYLMLKNYFDQKALVFVRITKKPPIDALSDGVTFEFGDSGVA